MLPGYQNLILSYGVYLQLDSYRGYPGKPNPTGTIAVILAGTDLGELFTFWDGTTHRPLPSEVGHADFAPPLRAGNRNSPIPAG